MTLTAPAHLRGRMIDIPPEKLVYVAFAVKTWSRCHDCEELLGTLMAKSVLPSLRPKRPPRAPQAPSPQAIKAKPRRETIQTLHKAGYPPLEIAVALKVSAGCVYDAIRKMERADA